MFSGISTYASAELRKLLQKGYFKYDGVYVCLNYIKITRKFTIILYCQFLLFNTKYLSHFQERAVMYNKYLQVVLVN